MEILSPEFRPPKYIYFWVAAQILAIQFLRVNIYLLDSWTEIYSNKFGWETHEPNKNSFLAFTLKHRWIMNEAPY